MSGLGFSIGRSGSVAGVVGTASAGAGAGAGAAGTIASQLLIVVEKTM